VVVTLDTPCSEVVWRYWLHTPFASFVFTSPPVRHRVSSHFGCTVPWVTAVGEYWGFVNARRQNICSSNFGSAVQLLTLLPCVYCYKMFWRWYCKVINVGNALQKFALGRLVAQHLDTTPFSAWAFIQPTPGPFLFHTSLRNRTSELLLRRHSVRVSRGTSSILTEVWVVFLILSRKLFGYHPQIMPRPPSSTNKQTN